MISFFTENGKDIIGFPEKLLQTFSNTGLYRVPHLFNDGIFWANILWVYDPYCNEDRLEVKRTRFQYW